MNKELESITRHLDNVFKGDPWYGRSVLPVLEEIKGHDVFKAPYAGGHSLIELLYHTLNWTNFVLKRVEKDPKQDIQHFMQQDWITIVPGTHTWAKGLKALKQSHKQLITLLQKKDDDLLTEMVEGRKFNYRVMLYGLTDHYIYHLGQVVYVKKWLESNQ
jgi:uncharacterized damage-inducible protein DinB